MLLMLAIILFAMVTSLVFTAAIVIVVLAVLHTAMVTGGVNAVAVVSFMLTILHPAMVARGVIAAAIVRRSLFILSPAMVTGQIRVGSYWVIRGDWVISWGIIRRIRIPAMVSFMLTILLPAFAAR